MEVTGKLQPTAAHYADGIMVVDDDFGDDRLKGNQHKGMVLLKHADGSTERRFIKTDKINLTRGPAFRPEYDVQFASVGEAISSCLVRSLVPDVDFPCVDYQFEVIREHGKLVTATSSANYVVPGTLEMVLTDNDQNPYLHYRVTPDEFIDQIALCKVNAEIMTSMRGFYERYLVDRNLAQHFIVQQAAFDFLLGNADRKENLANTIFLAHRQQLVTPLNFDYNRCLNLGWPETTNAAFMRGQVQLGDAGIEADYLDSIYTVKRETPTKGLFGNSAVAAENVRFMQEQGFVRFRIDTAKLRAELDQTCTRIAQLAPHLKYVARTKANVLLRALAAERNHELWEEA